MGLRHPERLTKALFLYNLRIVVSGLDLFGSPGFWGDPMFELNGKFGASNLLFDNPDAAPATVITNRLFVAMIS